MKHRALKANIGGDIQLKTLEDREHIVAPVVALVEGVIHASNSTQPELVLAEEFGKVPQAWNGRFAMFDHPAEDNGDKTSANQPSVVDRLRLGTCFNARVEDKKLKMDVWIDTEKATKVGEKARQLVDAIGRGEVVEVSVGVFTVAEESSGTHNGQRYAAIWREIVPDHLALLPQGTIGACSIEMGCGTRAAAKGGDVKAPWNEAKRIALRQFIAAQENDTSDRDIRMALERALFAEEPAFLGVVDVFTEAKQVVYAVAPEDKTMFLRRDFELAEDKTVKLGSKKEEVKQVTKYEAASAAIARAACGCGGSPKVEPAPKEDDMADKKTRATAALTKLAARNPKLFALSDVEVYANASEERLKALEEAAEDDSEKYKPGTPHPPTPPPTAVPGAPPAAPQPQAEPTPPIPAPPNAPDLERDKDRKEVPPPVVDAAAAEAAYLAKAPESIRSIVAQHKAATAAKKTTLVNQLKAAQAVYSEGELNAMDVPQLEKLAALAAKPDFSGLGAQRLAAAEDANAIPAAPKLSERLAARK